MAQRQYELRALKKAYTDNKKLTYRYKVETVDANGKFKVKYLKIAETDMRARNKMLFEIVNLKTNYRRILTRTQHSNLKDQAMKRR